MSSDICENIVNSLTQVSDCYSCDECTYNNNCNLTFKTHTTNQCTSFHCDKCENLISLNGTMKKHIETSHDKFTCSVNNENCDLCVNINTDKKDLDSHLKLMPSQ